LRFENERGVFVHPDSDEARLRLKSGKHPIVPLPAQKVLIDNCLGQKGKARLQVEGLGLDDGQVFVASKHTAPLDGGPCAGAGHRE
jgi:hypothetical protein